MIGHFQFVIYNALVKFCRKAATDKTQTVLNERSRCEVWWRIQHSRKFNRYILNVLVWSFITIISITDGISYFHHTHLAVKRLEIFLWKQNWQA